jgi:hypothetical protein
MNKVKQELADEMRSKLSELNEILKKAFEAGLNHRITGNTTGCNGYRAEIEVELYEEIKY